MKSALALSMMAGAVAMTAGAVHPTAPPTSARRGARTGGHAEAVHPIPEESGVAPQPDGPLPAAFRLTRESRKLARRIGVEFNGVRRNDVYAYDVEEGWIEIADGVRLQGFVEPYWRTFAEPVYRPPADPAPIIAAAEAKRARKAAKLAKIAAKGGIAS